ncbi:MAG: tRNA pseudouridine(55) synthase TruB [Bacteroidota bacterium]
MNDVEPPSIQNIDFQAGSTLLIDKPKGWTSFDVVNKVRHRLRKLTGIKRIKVGHAGTLDPLATGLLILCTGKFTKKLTEFQGWDKEYTGTFLLGGTTPSYDAETEVDQTYPHEHIDETALGAARQGFLGTIEQVPPMFSAIKVNGQPLYKKARKGEKVEIKARTVHIHEFELDNIQLPEVSFRLKCSKGTYVRSLAHDMGKALDSGAYLTALRRTEVGPYRIENAWNLNDLIEALEARIEEKDRMVL